MLAGWRARSCAAPLDAGWRTHKNASLTLVFFDLEAAVLQNPMLDVFIGLIFFYMLLSVIVTVAQEVISSYLNLRSKNLRTAISELIGEANLKDFYNHPLIFSLFRGGVDDQGRPIEGGPSYIPKRNFALAALDLARKFHDQAPASTASAAPLPPVLDLVKFLSDPEHSGSLGTQVKQFDQTATELIGKISNPVVKEAANHALTVAVGKLTMNVGKLDTVTEGIESLFDSTMDRTSGWYKVNAQRISLGIALGLAVALNADSFFMGKLLWEDEALRKGVVDAAESYYQSAQGKASLDAICAPQAAVTSDSPNAKTDPQGAVRKCAQNEVRTAMAQLSPYPIGWPMTAQQQPTGTASSIAIGWLGIGVGWLLTGLAVSLGSGFWFDMLGKVMSIRMAGKREATGSST